MKILLLGGTTEGREILESGLPVVYSAATEYGAALVESAGAQVRVGPMDAEEMEFFIVENGILGVMDATHPHALEVSRNARQACERTFVPYIRVVREFVKINGGEVTVVGSCEEAARLLNDPARLEAKALLTVGSKKLTCFTAVNDYRKRLFVRVLPVGEVLWSCEKMGFDAGHLIAMQGPFSREMNEATLKMTGARVLVTKDSGTAGGLEAKLDAARECGADVLLVRRPEETGMTVTEAVKWGQKLMRDSCPRRFPLFPFFVDIAGRKVLVVGGGPVALRRVRALLACGASVTVVSPKFHQGFGVLSQAHGENLRLIERRYEKHDFEEGDFGDIFMAVAATNDRVLNRRLGARGRKAGIPVSVADAPEECSFFFPSLVTEGEVTAAVSAGGCPSLNRRLSRRLREVWRDWVREAKREGREDP
jgi:precorrin-2 dehydrogenase/sirohydrochlorin ferrochelatase/precorrin-6A/cobalt-precorrin-6A reductase